MCWSITDNPPQTGNKPTRAHGNVNTQLFIMISRPPRTDWVVARMSAKSFLSQDICNVNGQFTWDNRSLISLRNYTDGSVCSIYRGVWSIYTLSWHQNTSHGESKNKYHLLHYATALCVTRTWPNNTYADANCSLSVYLHLIFWHLISVYLGYTIYTNGYTNTYCELCWVTEMTRFSDSLYFWYLIELLL